MTQKPYYSFDRVKSAAKDRWREILSTIGIPDDVLDGRHHGCPKCGGKDRFRFTNIAKGGSVICNSCGKFRSGIDVVAWWFGVEPTTALEAVAKIVDVQPEEPTAKQHSGHAFDQHLNFVPWSQARARWFLDYYHVTQEAIELLGGQLATYRHSYLCVAFPITGSHGQVTGRLIIAASTAQLPTFPQGPRGSVVYVRKLMTAGSKSGMLLPKGYESSTVLWKVEGPTDLLAMLSMPGRPPEVTACTNTAGAGENVATWIAKLWSGKVARIVGDADEPGQRGASSWALALSRYAETVYVHDLPYEVTPSHGKDIRDWIGDGRPWGDLEQLGVCVAKVEEQPGSESPAHGEADCGGVSAETAEQIKQRVSDEDGVIREYWDPEYLAIRHLEFYEQNRPGSRLAYHRESWLKYNGVTWKELAKSDLECYVRDSINRVYREMFEEQKTRTEGNRKPVRMIRGEVQSTMAAIAARCHIPHSVNLNRHWDFRTKSESERSYLRLQNGILDIDAMLRNAELEEALLPHTPSWFSTVCLPYKLDLQATCPQWMEVLRTSVGDCELIELLQEWAGYILTHSTDQQKMLILYGDGANGKSVILAAMQAMLGRENCSTVPLESFSDDFSVIETHGKLLNVSPDSGEIGRNAEGVLKAFTSGDRMQMNRKNKSAISVEPTARLMISTNSRPRFTDRSGGIWRRLLLVPMNVTIPQDQRVLGMDKLDWWERSGELPGILLWALAGLARLKRNGRFTTPEISISELEEYRDELNPARRFLREFTKADPSESVAVRTLYDAYRKWCEETNTRPMPDSAFGKEISRIYPEVLRRRRHADSWDATTRRTWFYDGLSYHPEGLDSE